MAKSPTIKFPRISAGFYSVTMNGEFVGYVMKDVDLDTKETNWYVFDDNVQGKDIAMLQPKNAISNPDSLLREAKDSAKKYFLNRPVPVKVMEPVSTPIEVELNEETLVEDFHMNDISNDEEIHLTDAFEGDDFIISNDDIFPEFEDESEPVEDVVRELSLV